MLASIPSISAIAAVAAFAPPWSESELPAAPEGFAVELVQEAPELVWPSAVHCLADGSLLVAEDPMDMVGPADRPIDRILHYRWLESGGFERSVFADGLYAVFGMQEIDGAVYVVNMPHLTVLRDLDGDGVADERVELLRDLGPPAPGWPGGFNDHVVSGIRLGMDGWLYVSVGDKGIPSATGTDGSRITLRGGGVVRLRPDGSRLEIVASGTRNHLDVALDERDEIFTYDNTDDGWGWWTRLTHVVPGGRYGYPWDYRLNPERMLPAMADYGGGSPTGGLVYRGGAWPEQYQGSLFFCEWGKSALRRFELEPEGASFRVTHAEDFLTGGALESFRPTDVCTSPDGRFLYVADWGVGTWKTPERTGRLFRVRRAGDDAPPKGVEPRLFAGEGRERAHPNFRARLLAQRELAALAAGELAPEVLVTVLDLASSERPATVRRHALWLLEEVVHASLDVAPQASALAGRALRRFLLDPSAELRAEAARALGSRGLGTPAELAPLLDDPDPNVRRQAATAIWRSGEPAAAEALAAALGGEDDPFVRAPLRAGLVALGRFQPLLARFPGRDERERQDLVLVLRELHDAALVDELARLADPQGSAEPQVRALAVQLAGELARKEEPWDGTWWETQPTRSGHPPKVLAWEGTARALDVLRAALADPEPAVRRAALDALERLRERELLPHVRARFADEEEPALRARILALLESLRDADAHELLAAIVADPHAERELRMRAVQVAAAIATREMMGLLTAALDLEEQGEELALSCLEALGRLREPETAESVRARLADTRPRVRAAAVRAVAAIDGKESAGALRALLAADPAPIVRAAAAAALAELDVRDAVPDILALADELETRDAAIGALARMPDARALPAYIAGLEGRSRELREASARALRAIRGEAQSALEGLRIAGELSVKALAQVQWIYAEPRPIARWRIVGPIPQGENCPPVSAGPIDVSEGFALGEARLEPIEHASAHQDGQVDLRALLGEHTNAVAYAEAELRSPAARTAEVALGSDDSIALWVNGELVHEFPGERAWAPEQARFEVRLREGPNRIAARIGQVGGEWAFSVKVAPAGSGPLFEGGLARAFDVRGYREYALSNPGDAERGRAIYFDDAVAACARCHALAGVGARVGPDLGDVGLRMPRAELATAVLEPSLQVADGYRASWIELASGEVVFGQVQREEDGAIWIVDASGTLRELELADVADRGRSPLSLMPDGIQSLLTPKEFSDLLSFLESLRGER